MKKAINLLMLLLLYVVAASAQKYDVKCLRGDSVAVYDVVETIRSEDTYYSKGEKLVFYYNPQNEMFWHFRTKCSFSKTKRTS